MLLNEFLKEHKNNEQQQATIAELKSNIARQQEAMEALTAQLKEQSAQIQKVSAQVEMSKAAQQMALNWCCWGERCLLHREHFQFNLSQRSPGPH
jgi:septal ring factor EnvC (AmiA/AmiB activator)